MSALFRESGVKCVTVSLTGHTNLAAWGSVCIARSGVRAIRRASYPGADGTWKKARRPNSLLPTEVMSVVFKAKFCDGFRELLRQGGLTLPPDTNEEDALRELNQALSRSKWVVDRRKPYRHGKGVLTYFARYCRGGPLPRLGAPLTRRLSTLARPPPTPGRGREGGHEITTARVALRLWGSVCLLASTASS